MKSKSVFSLHQSYIIFITCFLIIPSALSVQKPSDGEPLRIGDPIPVNGRPPYLNAIIDHAGYSDVINYGTSPIHSYNYHELLSGEWGAALYYDGIKDAPQAMWMTDYFLFPYWTTNSEFYIEENTGLQIGAWHDPNNPTPLNNTGRSVIYNDQVEIQIDYEVVDLGWEDPNNWIGSPLACWDTENNKSGYVLSDRYLFLQTYTITNIQEPNLPDPNLRNLEFYQMLHSHGDDEYGNPPQRPERIRYFKNA